MPNGAKRWCFTINNPQVEDEIQLLGTASDGPQADYNAIQYLIMQEERGENGTLHWQGFLILKERHTLSWLKERVDARAHWEIARGTNEQARDYCKKDETYTGGMRHEYGALPERAALPKRDERLQQACEELDILKEGYKRPSEIPSLTLMQCGFIPAMKELTADVLGPYRPELKIITLVGEPGTGKSYAIQHCFPFHGRCIYGNNGAWFQNPTADVMIFEEFNGQIPLQRMLQLLDPYPLALEVKGRMAPAMYRTAIITSNSSPDMWYPMGPEKEDNADQIKKRRDAVHALWDRLGYSSGGFIPARTCGHYIEAPSFEPALGMNRADYINNCRKAFMNRLLEADGRYEDISDVDQSDDEYNRDTQEERRIIGY